jgi:hypothetical protein
VTFNAFTTVRVFLLGQNDRANDLMAGDLRSQKHFPVRKLRVGEFHELTAWAHMFPFILHLFDLASASHASASTPLFITPVPRIPAAASKVAPYRLPYAPRAATL